MTWIINKLVALFNFLSEFAFGLTSTGDRRIWAHWSNENEKYVGGKLVRKGVPYHGRLWIHTSGRLGLCFTWNFWSHFCGAEVRAGPGGDDSVVFHLSFPPVSFWLGIRSPFPFEWWKKHWGYEEMELSVRVFDWAIWWNFWTPAHSWSNKTPKYRNGNWHFLDTLLGDHKHSDVDLSTTEVVIPMPEGNYPATVRLFESTWKRPRWFARRLVRADIKMHEGYAIPAPGKGESSWDCGDNPTLSMTTPASTVEEAIAAMVKSSLRTRRRHGGGVMMKYPAPQPTGG